MDILKNFSDLKTTNGVVEEIFRSEVDEIILPISNILNKWLTTVSCKGYKRIHDLQKNNLKLSYVVN